MGEGDEVAEGEFRMIAFILGFFAGIICAITSLAFIGSLDEPLREPFPPAPNESCGND